MEDKNNGIKNNKKHDNFIIEENMSLNFQGKKEKNKQNKTKNKKLTNQKPILLKKTKTL